MKWAIVLAAGAVAMATSAAESVVSEAYLKIWNAEEQARIDADIEANRKANGEFAVNVPDGTLVHAQQLTHAFRFGAHIFNFNQLGKREWNNAYKASYGAGGLFNQATVSFYWSAHEPFPGKFRFEGSYEDSERFWNSLGKEEAMKEQFWRRPAPLPVIDFLKAKDVAIHGHILIWGYAKPYWIYDWYCPENEKQILEELGIPRHSTRFDPNWIGPKANHIGWQAEWRTAWKKLYKQMDEKTLAAKIPVFTANMRKIFRKRIFDVASVFGDVADSWDVVNESAQDWVRYRSAISGQPLCYSNYGIMPGDYPLHALLDAKEAISPSAKLAINDWLIGPEFLEQTKQLEEAGARIDIVGCQMHIFNTNNCARLAAGATDVNWVGSPKTIRDRLDMMAKTGKPLHVSEVTIAAPGVDEKSKQIQAILVRNIYRAWFSHKAVMGVTWWNTVDGAAFIGEPSVSGLFTRDLQKKPAYYALDQLINHEWKTTLDTTASNGKVAFRGFKGRYKLTWKDAEGKEHSSFAEIK